MVILNVSLFNIIVFKMHVINVNIVFVWALKVSCLFIIQWLLHWYLKPSHLVWQMAMVGTTLV